MNQATLDRLFGVTSAFDHPVTVGITIGVVGALVAAAPLMAIVFRWRQVEQPQREELWKRYRSWLVLAPLMFVPVLIGAATTIAAIAVLSILCYREFARATGLFREKMMSATVVVGMLFITFAVADHWYGFFMALGPLGVSVIAAVAILADRPKGYIQRVALGTWGFLLFGVGLGHLGYMANDVDYRPLILTILVCVEANDIFAYLAGKSIGHRKLVPNTSPNKTLGGALGAVLLTTALYALLGHFLFEGSVLASPVHLMGLGLIISVAGQLGDLMLSSIKRDLGIKDMGVTLPGHGGLLDRFDSLILVAPAVYHYVAYFRGFGLDQEIRIITGG
ncbi:MAG: phosphatidate cytidylyltransferase [Planctomycetes bacterium]|nr:phosphatidate cytidylyltransferase [Planctomycetota bacterium]